MLFNIDGEKWTLVLNPEERKVFKGEPEGKPTLTLTISDENFVKLVMGKMGPQQVMPLSDAVSEADAPPTMEGQSHSPCCCLHKGRIISLRLDLGTCMLSHVSAACWVRLPP